jgi:DNA-binding phage protein
MKRTFRDYQEKLLEDLQDPELATAYLNVALTDEDPRVFLLALKNVCEAQGKEMTTLAKKTESLRDTFYEIYSYCPRKHRRTSSLRKN